MIETPAADRRSTPVASLVRGWFACIAAAVACIAVPLDAQAVMGIGEQVLGPPRGVVRVTIAPSFETFDERFLPDGETEPLGARLTTPALGASVFPAITGTSAAVRTLSGSPGFEGSLGISSLRASTSVNTLRLGAELGLTDRLSLMASVPLVRARTELQLDVNGAGGNLGINPALLDPDLAVFNQGALDAQNAAWSALDALIATCTAPGATDGRCPEVQANLTTLQALSADATAAAAASAALYSPDAPFAPVQGGSADAAIAARLDALAAAFAAWPTLGLPLFPGAVFAPAEGPIGSQEAPAVLGDPAFGIGIDSLVARSRFGVGDIEVGMRLLLLDSPGRERRLSPGGMHVRLAVTGGARLGTGEAPDADQPFDPGTGDGQTDLIGAAHLDLLFGGRFWTTISGRYVRQLEDRQTMRIAPPWLALAPLASRHEVERDLGDYIELEVAPRIVLGRYLSIGARYAMRDKEADRHTLATGAELPPEGLPFEAEVLDSATAYTVQELGVGFTYSTMAAKARGLARLPIEVTYQHVESLSASDGYVPKRRRDEVRIRVYLSVFGGR
ncbi:MAG TPA: hypothetical protein VK922_18165 [Gemmatimonadaceae bacterium]|nr:hypothetical protein [Gemmatimonadaceae bacterium]